jgi:hypothetical protein
MDRYWNVHSMNEAARRFFALLLGSVSGDSATNVLRAMFDPCLLRPHVENWEMVAEGLIQRMRRESLGGLDGDPKGRRLLAELMAYPGVPPRWASLDLDRVVAPVVPVTFRSGDVRLSFFSTVTTLGTPQDIRLEETRIECFFPADEETERIGAELLAGEFSPAS